MKVVQVKFDVKVKDCLVLPPYAHMVDLSQCVESVEMTVIEEDFGRRVFPYLMRKLGEKGIDPWKGKWAYIIEV